MESQNDLQNENSLENEKHRLEIEKLKKDIEALDDEARRRERNWLQPEWFKSTWTPGVVSLFTTFFLFYTGCNSGWFNNQKLIVENEHHKLEMDNEALRWNQDVLTAENNILENKKEQLRMDSVLYANYLRTAKHDSTLIHHQLDSLGAQIQSYKVYTEVAKARSLSNVKDVVVKYQNQINAIIDAGDIDAIEKMAASELIGRANLVIATGNIVERNGAFSEAGRRLTVYQEGNLVCKATSDDRGYYTILLDRKFPLVVVCPHPPYVQGRVTALDMRMSSSSTTMRRSLYILPQMYLRMPGDRNPPY